MNRRLRHTIAFTLTAALCGLGAMVTAEPASALRSPVNPVTVELNWATTYGKLRMASDFFACETTTPASCTQAQRSRFAAARRHIGHLPKMRAIGTLTLAVGAFELGWKIGRVIDTQFLHLSGPALGTTDSLDCSVAGAVNLSAWRWREAGTYAPTIPLGRGVWTVDFVGTCNSQNAGGSEYTPGLSAHHLAKQAATAGLSVGAPHQTGTISGHPTYVYMMEEAEMELATGANETPEPWVAQPFGATTNVSSPSPTPPAWSDIPGQTARAELVGDEATAIATAGTAAEEDTAAWAAGNGVDSDWEGYEGDGIAMPDCSGLTVAGCTAALEAVGHVGTITELELDIATADVTRPALALVSTFPPATTTLQTTDPVEFNLNPDPMPLVLPAPEPTETYSAYITRLQALGWVGTATVTTLSEGAGVPELGPDVVVTVQLPVRTPLTALTVRLPGGWPVPGPRVHLDTDITFTRNPTTYPPVSPESVPPATGGGLPPGGLDFGPINDLDWGCKFPFGFVCYALDVTGWFDVAADAPVFSFALPSVTVLGTAYVAEGDYVVDLDVMDDYMSLLRDLMSVALWVGTVYFLATRLLGFRSGDPGEAVDEGLDWQ